MFKCPQCGNQGALPLMPTDGTTHYFLPSINVETKELKLDTGLPGKAYGCVSCQAVFFKSDSIGKKFG